MNKFEMFGVLLHNILFGINASYGRGDILEVSDLEGLNGVQYGTFKYRMQSGETRTRSFKIKDGLVYACGTRRQIKSLIPHWNSGRIYS